MEKIVSNFMRVRMETLCGCLTPTNKPQLVYIGKIITLMKYIQRISAHDGETSIKVNPYQ